MTSNDLVLLDRLFGEWKTTAPGSFDDAVLFEIFVAEQQLKDNDASAEDVLSGVVGGKGDGGIDALYTLLNGEVLDEDMDLTATKRDADLSLVVAQAKRSESFDHGPFDKLTTTLRHLLDLTRSRETLSALYSDELIDRTSIFRKALVDLAARPPKVSVTFVYATRGSTDSIDPTVREKARDLEAVIREQLPNASVRVVFAGARELLEEARREPSYTLPLTFIENPISANGSYVVLVKLKDYARFISDETGARRKYIFESNVRDFQGDVEVNTDIQRTLQAADGPDFWWLNNGVTIIASSATITGKVLALDDVQIVNGLQTSVRVQEFVATDPERADERSLLCRIVVVKEDPVTRDRIIKATNFQTAIPAATLKATEQVHRDIERYFLSEGWYYDRRKSYYKNLKRPADRIVSIAYLAQAIMAMGLGRPDDSRARPTSLIKKPEDYREMFDEGIPLSTYLWAARTMKQVEAYVRQEADPDLATMKRELKFHLAMWIAARALGRRIYRPVQMNDVTNVAISDEELGAGWSELRSFLGSYPDFGRRPLDAIAKSRDFVTHIFGHPLSTPVTPA